MAIWYICCLIGIFSPILVSITYKNLATLVLAHIYPVPKSGVA
jgi:hypothetical protein